MIRELAWLRSFSKPASRDLEANPIYSVRLVHASGEPLRPAMAAARQSGLLEFGGGYLQDDLKNFWRSAQNTSPVRSGNNQRRRYTD